MKKLPIWAALAASMAMAAPAPPAATKMYGLFEQLRAAARTRQHVDFQVSESEINEYMRYSLKASPRPGVNAVSVKFFPHNYVSTLTLVDFDAIERWKPGTIPALLRVALRGQKTIWLDFRFLAQNSQVTFSVEKAYYGGLRLPAFFVERMIRMVAARQPEKYDTSKPLPLPFGLRQVWTANHLAAGRN